MLSILYVRGRPVSMATLKHDLSTIHAAVQCNVQSNGAQSTDPRTRISIFPIQILHWLLCHVPHTNEYIHSSEPLHCVVCRTKKRANCSLRISEPKIAVRTSLDHSNYFQSIAAMWCFGRSPSNIFAWNCEFSSSPPSPSDIAFHSPSCLFSLCSSADGLQKKNYSVKKPTISGLLYRIQFGRTWKTFFNSSSLPIK